MRWRLFLEEYSPDIWWLKGSTNLVADALSRLPYNHEPIIESHVTEELCAFQYCYGQDEQSALFPLSYEVIGKAQSKDKSVLKALESKKYHFKSFHRDETQRELICHKGKIVIPQTLTKQVMEWYHMYLGHPGINRTEETISQHLWWPKMRDDITQQVSTCDTCQKNKRKYKKYGLIPPCWSKIWNQKEKWLKNKHLEEISKNKGWTYKWWENLWWTDNKMDTTYVTGTNQKVIPGGRMTDKQNNRASIDTYHFV